MHFSWYQSRVLVDSLVDIYVIKFFPSPVIFFSDAIFLYQTRNVATGNPIFIGDSVPL